MIRYCHTFNLSVFKSMCQFFIWTQSFQYRFVLKLDGRLKGWIFRRKWLILISYFPFSSRSLEAPCNVRIKSDKNSYIFWVLSLLNFTSTNPWFLIMIVFDANSYIICTLIIKSIFLSTNCQGKKSLFCLFRHFINHLSPANFFSVIDFLFLYVVLPSDNIIDTSDLDIVPVYIKEKLLYQ